MADIGAEHTTSVFPRPIVFVVIYLQLKDSLVIIGISNATSDESIAKLS